MLKRGAILAVLVISAVRPLAGQNAPAGTPKQGVAEQESTGNAQVQPQTQGNDQSAPKSVLATPSCDEACQQGRENLKIRSKFAWFTGGLVAVVFLQIVLIGWQAILLRQTRGDVHTQAEHMSRQADLMEKQGKQIARQGLSMRRQTTLLRKSA